MKQQATKIFLLTLIPTFLVAGATFSWSGWNNLIATTWDSLDAVKWNLLVNSVVQTTESVAQTITWDKTFSGNTTLTNATISQKLNTAKNTATISALSITYNGTYTAIDTEWGASDDDLDTINGGSDWDIIELEITSDSRNITLRHNAGNIKINEDRDVTMDIIDDRIRLRYNGIRWVETSRSLLNDFKTSKNTEWYTYLPNGVIFQWWRGTSVPANSNRAITFPIPFPTHNFVAFATYDAGSSGIVDAGAVNSRTTTGMNVMNGDSTARSLNWFAIGH